jgi:hypothetical protein
MMTNLFTCLLALFLVSGLAGADNKKKVVTNNNHQSAAPARPASAHSAQPATVRNARPAPRVQPRSNTGVAGRGSTGASSAITGASRSGSITGAKATTNVSGSGGISGTKSATTSAKPATSGITGAKSATTSTSGSGGITGTKSAITSAKPATSGITGAKSATTSASGSGGVSGTKSAATSAKPATSGITGAKSATTSTSGSGGITAGKSITGGATGSGGIAGTKSATTSASGSGGVTTGKSITGGATGSGGITGAKSATTSASGSGGVTAGKSITGGATGSGGITGAKSATTSASGSGGVTAGKSIAGGATGSGGITAGKSIAGGATGSGGVTAGKSIAGGATAGGKTFGTNRTAPQRPVYTPGKNVQTTTNKDGTLRHFNPQTQTAVHTDHGGHVTAVERPGLKATNFRADGHPAHIEQSRADGSRMVVNRGAHGERSVEVVRRDGVRVVTTGRQGFVERPIRSGYVARTYVDGGRSEVRVYRNYTYGRFHYLSFIPAVFFQPAFYGWASRPWAAPVVFGWGWGRPPWFYGGYFAPAPAYASAALWLTDFLLAEDLRHAYDDQMAAGEAQPVPLAANNTVVLTPEVKQTIAEEVQREIAAEQAAAAQPASTQFTGAAADAPPPVLDARLKVVVVSTDLNLNAGPDGQTCALTPGDVIKRTSRNLTADGQVPVGVLVSKDGDCPTGFASALDVGVLQDVQNDFREQIAAGLAKLASGAGRGGLPVSPAADPRQVAEGQAPASPDAADLLTQQAQEADQTEAQVNQAAVGQT